MNRRLTLTVAALAVGVAVGTALARQGADGGIGYTEPRGNPSASASWARLIPPAQRVTAPDFSFAAPDGTLSTVSALKGKAALVNLWATWCPPCIAEMPGINAVQKKLGGARFQVVTISVDRGGAAVSARWLERAGLTDLAVYNADPARFAGGMLPTTLLLDAQGRVAWKGEGARDWDSPEGLAAITAVMGEK